MKATFYGIGYVGLVQAAVLADAGHHICCVDINEKKIADLKNGIIPLYEPDLRTLVDRNHLAGRLKFTTSATEGLKFSDIQFIAVGTPPDEDGSADLRYVLKVAETIASYMQEPKIIVNKSTVPVGTADLVKQKVNQVLESRGESLYFSVVSNPEFLKEGTAVKDCQRPDRIIIGTDSEETEEIMRELYAPFNRNHDKVIVMDIRSAELTKYAANCMLATKISFMNEIANIAEKVGADIEQVRMGIGSDPRIGYHFIYPGSGYGGSCFPKDVKALIHTANSFKYPSEILEAVEQTNNRQKHKLNDFINAFYAINSTDNNPLSGKVFALWGLSFKPNTDDMREAPSRVVMEKLWSLGASIQAYDPQAMDEAKRIYGENNQLILSRTKEDALVNADALIICTDWQNFKVPDFGLLKSTLKEPLIFDGRNLYDPESMKSHGFTYYAIGRGESVSKFD